MELRARKLLLIEENDPSLSVPESGISSNSSSAESSRLNQSQSSEDYSYSGNGGFSSYRMNPPFDSSMALTVLLLLSALFFIGFFSIYIRRFSEDSAVEAYRFRRRRPNRLSSSYAGGYRTETKGLDPDTVDSLPVYGYDGVGAKQGILVDCAICLSEFEKGECVKTIPFCGHVFHVECIDTWLESTVTCPLCRTPKLFPEVIECDARGEEAVGESGSTVVGGDTWSDEGAKLRRSISCSRLGERVMLSRSSSL